MAANFTEIGRVGTLEAGFQQVPFLNFHNIDMKHKLLKITIFPLIKIPIYHFTVATA